MRLLTQLREKIEALRFFDTSGENVDAALATLDELITAIKAECARPKSTQEHICSCYCDALHHVLDMEKP